MTDYSELKRLAEAANSVLGDIAIEMTLSSASGPNQSEINAVTAFTGAANPAAVLTLIAENERHAKNAEEWEKSCVHWMAERDQLKSENSRLQGELHAASDLIATYRRVNRELRSERDKLKAEVETLRMGAERYRWLRDSSEAFHSFYLSTPIWLAGARFSKENVDSSIDAAMSKGTGHD